MPLRLHGHKYKACPTVVDGIRFASKKEATRYGELKLLEKAGEIRGLRWQIAYPLQVTDARGHTHGLGKYIADFQYQRRRTDDVDEWELITEDVKGFRTPLYRWKSKHMAAQYWITIREV